MKDGPVLAFWPELEKLNLEAERRTAERSAMGEAEHPPREVCSNQNLRHYLWVKFHSEYRGFPLDKRFAQNDVHHMGCSERQDQLDLLYSAC